MREKFKNMKYYSGFSLLRLLYNMVFTKIIFRRNARLIRGPVYVRGINSIDFGENFTTGTHLRIDAFNEERIKSIVFGSNVEINDYVHIAAIEKVDIGNNVLIASKVFISDHNHGFYGYNGIHTSPYSSPKNRELSSSPVLIEDDVWLGEFVCVLPGVTIGRGTVVGAMSVVNKNLPPYVVAAGVPAKVIKYYDFDLEKWVKV